MDIKSIDKYLLLLFLLFYVIFPFNLNFLTIPFLIIIILIKLINIFTSNKITINRNNLDISIALFALLYLFSTFFISKSLYGSLLFPGNTTTILVATILYFLTNQLDLKFKKYAKYSLIFSVVILSVEILLSVTKIFKFIPSYDNYLPFLIYLTSLAPWFIYFLIKEKEVVYKFLILVSLLISVFALIVSFKFLPQPNLIPLKYMSPVVTETLKNTKLLGIGSGNFIESYNKYKSVEINNTKYWLEKPAYGSSFVFTLLTEIGILSILFYFAIIALFLNIGLKSKQNQNIIDLLPVLILFIISFIVPLNTGTIYLLFIALGLSLENKRLEIALGSKVVSSLYILPSLVLLIFASTKVYRIGNAEIKYYQAVEKLKQNKVKETYDLLKNSIILNKDVDRYHRLLSVVNFGIANTLAQNGDENQKKQVALFVQESINEAKATVSINNKSSENWQFLASSYHKIIPFTKGAEIFAIESYKQSLALDPTNVNTRIELGEIYMIQKNYDKAIETFNLAILAKSDHPNAHFNLGLAYKESGKTNEAKIEFNKTINLLSDNKQEIEKVQKEINNLSIKQ